MARSVAVPSVPYSMGLAEPQVSPTAQVHAFSQVVGDVYIGAGALIAPGTSIRADEGGPFHIGSLSQLQDGVVIHGLEQGRVLGDDQRRYSVWIGENTSITHMALIHGPAYVGRNCFIGFRSTVFNARVGENCIVMMHVLIQDVDVPPGKYVPSGSVITTQPQADALPDVQVSDIEFANRVSGVNQALRAGYDGADQGGHSGPVVNGSGAKVQSFSAKENSLLISEGVTPLTSNIQGLGAGLTTQVRQLLAQGFQVGTEYADKRRFRANAWHNGEAITATSESAVIASLEACMAQHQGQYVRLVGIDPRAKRRVLEQVIQRPDGVVDARNGRNGRPQPLVRSGASDGVVSTEAAGSDADLGAMVRRLLAQGLQVGTEHADKRRFRANAWMPCAPIATTSESAVMAALEACMAEHQGEYVRLIGIDKQAKRRVMEQIIQRPDGSGVKRQPGHVAGVGVDVGVGAGAVAVDADVSATVRQLLAQGLQVGTEHADKRRFRANAWMPCAPIATTSESAVMAALEACMAEHQGEYVRLIGIDKQAKRRVMEKIIQRPAGVPGGAKQSRKNGRPRASSSARTVRGSSKVTVALGAELGAQVRQLLAQGLQVGTEHADKRRFRANAWHSCAPITTTSESAVMAALEACMVEHQGEYVRLIGIDKQAKRRVSERVIQRP